MHFMPFWGVFKYKIELYNIEDIRSFWKKEEKSK